MTRSVGSLLVLLGGVLLIGAVGEDLAGGRYNPWGYPPPTVMTFVRVYAGLIGIGVMVLGANILGIWPKSRSQDATASRTRSRLPARTETTRETARGEVRTPTS